MPRPPLPPTVTTLKLELTTETISELRRLLRLAVNSPSPGGRNGPARQKLLVALGELTSEIEDKGGL